MHGSIHLPLILCANDLTLIKWYVDVLYKTHGTFKGHVGGHDDDLERCCGEYVKEVKIKHDNLHQDQFHRRAWRNATDTMVNLLPRSTRVQCIYQAPEGQHDRHVTVSEW